MPGTLLRGASAVTKTGAELSLNQSILFLPDHGDKLETFGSPVVSLHLSCNKPSVYSLEKRVNDKYSSNYPIFVESPYNTNL